MDATLYRGAGCLGGSKRVLGGDVGACVLLRRTIARGRLGHTFCRASELFRTCRRTRVCFEKPWKIFAALPSAEKYVRIVLTIETSEGPNTSRQSRESHGETRSTLLSQKVWKAWKSPNDVRRTLKPVTPLEPSLCLAWLCWC